MDTETWPLRGRHGAAGLLLTVPGPTPRVLLALRSAAVPHPHTWSVPAGALEAGEDPVEGALREAEEELGSLPPLTVCGRMADAVTPRWTFHTVIAITPEPIPIIPRGIDAWEIAGTRWVTPESGVRLPLHPRLRETWDRLMAVVARRQVQAALLR